MARALPLSSLATTSGPRDGGGITYFPPDHDIRYLSSDSNLASFFLKSLTEGALYLRDDFRREKTQAQYFYKLNQLFYDFEFQLFCITVID